MDKKFLDFPIQASQRSINRSSKRCQGRIEQQPGNNSGTAVGDFNGIEKPDLAIWTSGINSQFTDRAAVLGLNITQELENIGRKKKRINYYQY